MIYIFFLYCNLMIKNIFIILLLIVGIIALLIYANIIDINDILSNDTNDTISNNDELTEEEKEEAKENKDDIENNLDDIEKYIEENGSITKDIENWFLENLGTIITVISYAFEIYGLIDSLRDLQKIIRDYNPEKFKKLDDMIDAKKAKMKKLLSNKFENVKILKPKLNINTPDFKNIFKSGIKRFNKKQAMMFNKTVDGLSSLSNNLALPGKIADMASNSKIIRKMRSSVGALNDGLNTATGVIKTSSRGLKAIPFVGGIVAIGGAALCYASVNAESGMLENEYKDNPDAVTGGNIACTIELVVDIITEGLDYAIAIGFFTGALAGGLGVALVAFGIVVAIIGITGMILDGNDDCGYNRPLETDETLEQLKVMVLSNYFSGILDMMEDKKEEIKIGIKESLQEQLRAYNFDFTMEDIDRIVSDEEFQIEKFGKTFEETFGLTFDGLVDQQIASILEDIKYVKPYEFTSNNGSLFNNEDTDKYNSYLAEYYEKCNLIPDPLTLEERRAYSESRKLKNKQKLFLATLNLEHAKQINLISEQQLEQANQLAQTSSALLNMLIDLKDSVDAYQEGNKNKLLLLKEKAERNKETIKTINQTNEDFLLNIIEVYSDVLVEKPDFDLDVVLAALGLNDEYIEDIKEMIIERANEKKEKRDIIKEDLLMFINVRNELKENIDDE